jgi:hypothetical protein
VADGFFGKYRGLVVDNRDQMALGRIKVEVPEVLGDSRLSWAMPCVPYAGRGVGLIAPPPVGGSVWVEFEAGDPDRPIWTGCFWAPGEMPLATGAGASVLRVGGVTLVASDPDPAGPSPAAPVSPGAEATEVTLRGGSLVVSRRGQPVVTVDATNVTIRLDPLELALSAADGTARMGLDSAAVTVGADAVELTHASTSARVSGEGVALASGGASARVSPAAIELANGAAKITMTAAAVSINDGALEVT